MLTRWQWILIGSSCGMLIGAAVAFLVLSASMSPDWERFAPKVDTDALTWQERQESGMRVREQVTADGQKHGLFRRWFSDGRPSLEGQYWRDLEDGHWVYWNPDGSWFAVGGYYNGSMHGTWVQWNQEIGGLVLDEISTYDSGHLNGPRTAWRKDGTIESNITGWYEHGVKVRDLEPLEIHVKPGT